MEWHQQVGRAGSPRPSFTPQTLIQQQFIDSLPGKYRDWLKAPCWVNAEPDSLKLVGRFRTLFCQSPCFWPRAMRSGKGSQCLASPRGGKELVCVSSTPDSLMGLWQVLHSLPVRAKWRWWHEPEDAVDAAPCSTQSKQREIPTLTLSPGERQSWSMHPMPQLLQGYPEKWHLSFQSWSSDRSNTV